MAWLRRERGRAQAVRRGPVLPHQPARIDPAAMVLHGLSPENDVIVQGRLASHVSLHLRDITVARDGFVEADLHGATICVEGRVEGNLVAAEQVIVRRTGAVKGKIVAPRVILEHGARFEGEIEMTATIERIAAASPNRQGTPPRGRDKERD